MQNEQIRTPQFTLSFPSVFVPRAANPGQEPKYGLMAVFPKGTNLDDMKRIARDAATEKWGKNIPSNLQKLFKDGDVDANPEWGEIFKNSIYVRFSTKFKPPVVDRAVRKIEDPDAVYGGQKCVAVVHAYAYDNSGNKGVAFGLDALQIVGEGERIGYSEEAVIAKFDQLEPAPASPTDLFGGAPVSSPAAAPAAAGTTTASGSYDPFA